MAAEIHYTNGFTYRKLWRWRDARPHLEKALSLTRGLHSGDHAETAKCLTALGTVYTSLRKPEAVELHREALDMRRRLLGERHVLVAESMTKLAYALFQGLSEEPQWEAAEALFVDALAMYRALRGEHHRDVGSCLHNFGWMRYTQQRYREAEALYAEALGVFRAIGDLE
ncbi:MAG: tetratricopeptide repeat protein, partial [Chloroflexi bacterium]|nr:tetratricopeptide repeat protein [Chloroflexota bacterium]